MECSHYQNYYGPKLTKATLNDEDITNKIKAKNIPFGVGGVARMDQGLLKGEVIMKEHVRLGSSMVILSRTFKTPYNFMFIDRIFSWLFNSNGIFYKPIFSRI